MSMSKSIAKRPKKDRSGKVTGHIWRARYRDEQGKEHSKHFPRKSDGERWLDEVTASVVTGQYVAPTAGKISLRDFAEHWRSIQVVRPNTASHYETMLRRHVYPTLGHMMLSDLRPTHVQAWVKQVSEILAPSTVAVAHGILSACLKAAVSDRRIVHNPCSGTRLPEAPPTHIMPPTTAEVLRLHDRIDPRYRAMVHLCAASGMRPGEAYGLTVDRVDFLRATVTVDRQAVYVAKQPITFGPPKRLPASLREIPIPRDLVEALSAHIGTYGLGEHDLIFTSPTGGFIRRSTFSSKVWRPAVKAAGLREGTRFHDIRHYYASLLIRHGESVKTVQKRLGHATAQETLDTYGHLWPDSDDRTRSIAALAFQEPSADDEGTTQAQQARNA